MTQSHESVGDQIRAGRVAKGFGLRELARKVDKAPSYVSDIEYGRRVPSEMVLRDLCRVLDLDFDAVSVAAGRLGEEADRYLRSQPAARMLLRRAQERGLSDGELRNLIAEVDKMGRRRTGEG